jgi:hypothetical protein
MANNRQNPNARPGGRALVLLVTAAGLAWTVSGCSGLNESRVKPGDPLMGEKQPSGPTIGPPQPPQNRANMQVPNGPTATAAKSNAQMAANVDPLLGGKTLVIPDPNQPTQTVGGWQPKDKQPGVVVGAGGPGVTIRAPEQPGIQPVPPPTINGNLPPVPNTNATTPAPVPVTGTGPFPDYDQVVAALKQRGMVWQTQQGVAGGVRFTCGVASSQDPTQIQVFEATAPDYRSAMLAVINKIDQSR